MTDTLYKKSMALIDCEKRLSKLTKEFEQYKKESVKWSAEDFLYRAAEIGYKISKNKAQEALERMIYKHDAEIGICWITVDCYLREYGTRIKPNVKK